MGPRAELPAACVVDLFESPAWWRGEPKAVPADRQPLPEFDLKAARAASPGIDGEPVDRDLAELLLAAMLTREGRLQVDGPASLLIASLRPVARRLPELLDGLSLSTFEHGEPQGWFDMVGTGKPATGGLQLNGASASRASGRPRQCARWIIDAGPLSTAQLPRIRAAALATGTLDRAHLLALCDSTASTEDDAQLTAAHVMPALRTPDLAIDLLYRARVRTVVAAALADGLREASTVLTELASRLDLDVLEALGAEVARHVDFRTQRASVVAHSLAQWPGPALAAYAAVALQAVDVDPSCAHRWGEDLLRAVLAELGHGTVSPAGREALLSAGAALTPALAADLRVTHAVWAQLLASALDQGRVDVRAAAACLDVHRLRIPAAAANLSSRHLSALVDAVGWEQAHRLLFYPGFVVQDGEEYLQLVRLVLARCPEQNALDVLVAARTQLGRRTVPSSWDTTKLPSVRAHIQRVLASPSAARRLDALRLVMTLADGGYLQPWADVIQDAVAARPHALVPASLSQLDPGDAVLAARFCLDRRIGQMRTEAELPQLVHAWYEPADLDPIGLARAVLAAALRDLREPHGPRRALWVLRYVADTLVDGGHLLRSRRTGRVRDQQVQSLARSLVAALSGPATKDGRRPVALTVPGTAGADWLQTLQVRPYRQPVGGSTHQSSDLKPR
jgi:hypothetical protein